MTLLHGLAKDQCFVLVNAKAFFSAAEMEAILPQLAKAFGLESFSPAVRLPVEMDAIREAAVAMAPEVLGTAMETRDNVTFRVRARRSNKRFPFRSQEIEIDLVSAIAERLGERRFKLDLDHAEITLGCEVRDEFAALFWNSLPGPGGLPVGSNPRALTLLSGGIDSPVSSYMIAKRGVKLEMVHFFSPPYTSNEAKEKVLSLAKLLVPWCGRLTVQIVPFTEIQEEIRRNCPEEFFTLIMRRFMMRISQRVADQVKAKALVTGENLGQVASQTMEALRVTEDVVDLPVLRPLIGMDKEEIVRLSRKIGTFDTSILPYEDCCTVFTPRHPRTKPNLDEVREAEAVLDIEGLIDRAMTNREFVRIKL